MLKMCLRHGCLACVQGQESREGIKSMIRASGVVWGVRGELLLQVQNFKGALAAAALKTPSRGSAPQL